MPLLPSRRSAGSGGDLRSQGGVVNILYFVIFCYVGVGAVLALLLWWAKQ